MNDGSYIETHETRLEVGHHTYAVVEVQFRHDPQRGSHVDVYILDSYGARATVIRGGIKRQRVIDEFASRFVFAGYLHVCSRVREHRRIPQYAVIHRRDRSVVSDDHGRDFQAAARSLGRRVALDLEHASADPEPSLGDYTIVNLALDEPFSFGASCGAPAQWEDAAAAADQDGDCLAAAVLWYHAAGASLGHKRGDSYLAQARDSMRRYRGKFDPPGSD